MAEWTQEQSTKFTDLYKKLSELPHYNKIKDSVNSQLFPSNESLPYEEAESKLLRFISEHSGQDNLESRVNGPVPDKKSYRSLLAPVAAAASVLTLMYIGLPLPV